MKITIITATRNNETTIKNTIESVLSQTHGDVEHIIIDGASTDGSLSIIKDYADRYPDKIKYISEPDAGVYNAINKGIRMASGDVVGCLHGNDRFTSNNVLAEVAMAMNDEAVRMVYGDIHYVKSGSDKCVRYYSASDFTPEMLRRGIAPPHPSLYLRREMFEQYGLYTEKYLICGDFEMFVRLMLENGVEGYYLPIDMVAMTIGGLSTQLYHRLITNNREKYQVLKEKSIKISCFSLLKRYLCILKNNRSKN